MLASTMSVTVHLLRSRLQGPGWGEAGIHHVYDSSTADVTTVGTWVGRGELASTMSVTVHLVRSLSQGPG